MRIIHTGDWHMNHRLGRIDMTGRLNAAIQQIARYLQDKQADVLIVAGDLFSGRESRAQLQSALEFLKQTFTPFLAGGGTILTITGNHDSEAFFLTLRDAFDLVLPAKEGPDGVHSSGRLYVAPNARVIKLRGRSGQVVQFVLMPFPTPRAYLLGDGTRYKSIEEKNAAVADIYHSTLRRICDEKVDTKLPAVLVSHAQVGGVPSTDLFMAGDEHDVILDLTSLPTHFAYGAFGHIHRACPIGQGDAHFRYCGSLLPLDAGEAGQSKSVVYAEIAQSGLTGSLEFLPIQGPRLLDITIEAGAIDDLRETYPDCATALVKYRLSYDVAEHSDPFPLHEQIRNVFPYWYESLNEPCRKDGDAPGPERPIAGVNLQDLPGNVQSYLDQQAQYEGKDAPKADVLALANALLANQALVEALRDPHKTEKQLLADIQLMTALKEISI